MTRALFLAVALLPVSGCDSLADIVPDYVGGEVSSITLLTLPQTKPDGAGWDVSGPADPYVVVRLESGPVLFEGEPVRDPVPSRYPIRWAVSGVDLEMDELVWVGVYDDDVAQDDVVAEYRVRLSDVGGVVKPTTISLAGPGGGAMADVEVRWAEADG